MKIDLDTNGIIPFEDFELNWRWDDLHNPDIYIGFDTRKDATGSRAVMPLYTRLAI